MIDPILPSGPLKQLQTGPKPDPAQFQRPAATDAAEAVTEPEKKPTAAPGSFSTRPAPLLSVLPAARFVEEPEKSDASKTAAPKPSASASGNPPAQDAAPKQATGQKKALFPQIRWTPLRILCAAALTLALVLVLDQLVMPFVRYQRAAHAETEGNYDRAIEQYSVLGDYRDSAQRVYMLQDEQARALMRDGQYQQALSFLEATGTTHTLEADCLYALGVLAYNDGDPKTGLEYVSRLRGRFPKYEKIKELEQSCYYSLGNLKESDARMSFIPAQKTALYEEAIEAFNRVKNYFDSADRILECQYQLAHAYISEWNLEKAVALFDELGGYRDAADLRLACMFDFVLSHRDDTNQTVDDYLDELIAADYPGAATIQDYKNGIGFSFELIYGDEQAPLSGEVTDLSAVSIRYEISARDEIGPVLVSVHCTLPDGNNAWNYLNADGSAVCTIALEQLFAVTLFSSESGPILLSFEENTFGMVLQTLSFDYVAPTGEGG